MNHPAALRCPTNPKPDVCQSLLEFTLKYFGVQRSVNAVFMSHISTGNDFMFCYMVEKKKECRHHESLSLLIRLKRGIQKETIISRSSKSIFDRWKAPLTSESLLWSAGSETPRTDRLGPWTAFATTSVLCVCAWTCLFAFARVGYWSRLCVLSLVLPGPQPKPELCNGR